MESTFGKCETGICHEYQNIEIVKRLMVKNT